MKLMAFGGSGQLARELARRGIPLIGRDRADFEHPEDVAEAVRTSGADAIINAAAYTAVDRAESDPDRAYLINAESVGAMARAAAASGIALVHVSTDYVFDGQGTHSRRPDDATAPLGVYGASKRAGEEAVVAAGGAFAILRTSWVFSAHAPNFVTTMARLGAERDELRVVADQIGGPTPAADLADACIAAATRLAADPVTSGLYHFSGAPDASWADLARAVMAGAGLAARVVDVPSAEYPTPAARPLNSRLDCSATEAVFGLPRPDWQAGLRAVLNELGILVTAR